jgi:hypothetical protein
VRAWINETHLFPCCLLQLAEFCHQTRTRILTGGMLITCEFLFYHAPCVFCAISYSYILQFFFSLRLIEVSCFFSRALDVNQDYLHALQMLSLLISRIYNARVRACVCATLLHLTVWTNCCASARVPRANFSIEWIIRSHQSCLRMLVYFLWPTCTPSIKMYGSKEVHMLLELQLSESQ